TIRVRGCGWTWTRSNSTRPTIKPPMRRSSARFLSGTRQAAMRHAPILARRSGSLTDRRRSKASMSIRLKRPMRRFLCSFIAVGAANGDIGVMAEQVRRGIAWAYKNAASFGGDASRFYIGGHSSGGHLCGVALVTDWEKDFGLPADIVKGG